MKKILSIALIGLLLCSATLPALANGWGLLGGLYYIVEGTDVYDEYTAIADDGNEQLGGDLVNHAILSSRYHNQLLVAHREGPRFRLQTASTTAVYQPDDDRNPPTLEHLEDQGFKMTYSDEEWYVFSWSATLEDYYLSRATLPGVTILYEPAEEQIDTGVYLLWQSGNPQAGTPIGDARWYGGPVALSEFNITLTPRTMQDVRQMDTVRDVLTTVWADRAFGEGESWNGEKNGITLPVYSAPTEDSYRAAKGKAAVSTGGEMTLLGEYGEWTLVSYQVSERTSRIGFVHAQLMQNPVSLPILQQPQTLVTLRDTYLTDDPSVSEYEQVRIPSGAKLSGLAAFGPYYAYVAYEGAGQTCWGFVPMRDLIAPAWEMDLSYSDTDITGWTPLRWDVMDRLVGKWEACDDAPETALPAQIVLSANGWYRFRTEPPYSAWLDEGRWRVIASPEGSPYAGKTLYQMTFHNEVQEVITCGLIVESYNVITLITEDGATRFMRDEYSTYGNG